MGDNERRERIIQPENVNFAMKNPVIETIRNRRSVRAYEPKPISRNIIKTIIEAGNQAPCMGKEDERGAISQPWRFVVVEDSEFKQKLVQTTLPIWKRFFESIKEADPENYKKVMDLYDALLEPKDPVYYSAPVILFVIGPADDPNPINCALACENVMLAATSLGLGSCYVGFGSMVKGNADVLRALELKNDERIYGPVLLGYPRDLPEANALRWKKKEPVIKWI
jgi:nitroreductase